MSMLKNKGGISLIKRTLVLLTTIMDYDSIPDEYKESILIAFSEGIRSGYTDNTFRYDQLATRAEAASIIIRLIDIDASNSPDYVRFFQVQL